MNSVRTTCVFFLVQIGAKKNKAGVGNTLYSRLKIVWRKLKNFSDKRQFLHPNFDHFDREEGTKLATMGEEPKSVVMNIFAVPMKVTTTAFSK